MQKLPQDHEVPFSRIVEQGKGYVTRRPSAVPLNRFFSRLIDAAWQGAI